jgi:membrane glycosyltransferase
MDSVAAFTLLIATFFVVMLPKIVGLALGVRSRAARTRNGGAAGLTGGVLVETVFSMLVAPILMLTQSTAVFQILLGRDSGWKAQRRDDGSMLIKDALKFHRWHVVIGAIAALLCWQVSPQVTGWMAPILLGLTLSVGLTWWTSRVGPAWLDRALKTEEDLSPPEIVVAANQRLVEWRTRLAAGDGEPAPRPNNGTGLPRAA